MSEAESLPGGVLEAEAEIARGELDYGVELLLGKAVWEVELDANGNQSLHLTSLGRASERR